MRKALGQVKEFINHCSEKERRVLLEYLRSKLPRHPLEEKWDVDAETILTAIYRSTDLTQRGMRGILAEAVFERDILPSIEKSGWHVLAAPVGDLPCDFLLERQTQKASIQVKLQRTEKGTPKRYQPRQYVNGLYVVEVQKTRSGKKRQQETPGALTAGDESTRPYGFGDFDVLAVNMQPTTHKWTDFRSTLCSWLIPRGTNSRLIEIFQPVSLEPNDVWTDKLAVCLEWFRSGERRMLRQLLRDPEAAEKR